MDCIGIRQGFVREDPSSRHAYLFANRHSTRMKVVVYDGLGIWLAARRLNKGKRQRIPS
ncbi:IS66 family insertion sequence element accessory protein TnpB [Caballeronia sordidicola]|uniref:IS66 family insertion sequence element accessory protein TnpB n=1 Tax=Caballeronia sordidicola TaxID=196367 RepID=UPI0015C5217A